MAITDTGRSLPVDDHRTGVLAPDKTEQTGAADVR